MFAVRFLASSRAVFFFCFGIRRWGKLPEGLTPGQAVFTIPATRYAPPGPPSTRRLIARLSSIVESGRGGNTSHSYTRARSRELYGVCLDVPPAGRAGASTRGNHTVGRWVTSVDFLPVLNPFALVG